MSDRRVHLAITNREMTILFFFFFSPLDSGINEVLGETNSHAFNGGNERFAHTRHAVA
jgi:hypothetical protein